jgi:hypothetical protein
MGILGVAACSSTLIVAEKMQVQPVSATATSTHPSAANSTRPSAASPTHPSAASPITPSTPKASAQGNAGGGPNIESCAYKSADDLGQVVYAVANGPMCGSNFTSGWHNSVGWTSIPSVPAGANNALWCSYSRADDSSLSVLIGASENDNQVADGICDSFSQVPAWQSSGGENPTGQGFTGFPQ